MDRKIRKIIFLAVTLGCVQVNIFSQSAFGINMEKDIVIGFASLGIGITPFFINNEPDNIFGILDKSDVNTMDRAFMFPYNKYLDYISDYYITLGLAALPVISVIPNIKNAKILLSYGIMYAESLLLTYGTVFSFKGVINRCRPYMYDSGVPSGKERDYHNSFPSSATAFAFLGASFLSAAYSRDFPESK